MQRIKLNERQILMLKKLQEGEPKKTVLRINEEQFNRLFKGNSTPSSKLSKTIKKVGIDEESTKDIDIVEFAQELIVFIKDVLSRPRSMPFSPYWDKIGMSKDKLFRMAKEEGLLTLTDESSDVKEYVTPKIGFRKRIKELYKKISEKHNSLNELGDAGYPAGADMNPNNPIYQNKSQSEKENESIKADKEIMKLTYFNNDLDGLAIFNYKNELFYISLADINGDETEPYEDIIGHPNADTIYNYVNDKLARKELKAFRHNKAPHGQLVLITPELKQQLIKWYGSDEKLTSILNQLPESTGASSSGSYVAGMSTGPIKRGLSPEKAMGDIVEQSGIDKKYTHFAIYKPTGKIVDGWDYKGVDLEDIKYYSKYDLIENFPEFKVSQFKIVQTKGLTNQGINPFDSNNWGYPTEEGLGESTTTTSVGGDSGTFAYDAPAGDGSAFWNAGNKLKKGNTDKTTKGVPIVRGGMFTESIKVGQVYKSGNARRKVLNIVNNKNPLAQTMVVVKQWGDSNEPNDMMRGQSARELKIPIKQFGNWELIHEHKVLKITEAQLKKIIESENMKSTAYPNGEMVSFDDCTKLNNNTEAQDGKCSQGSEDNVVKYKKTNDSVVAETAKQTGKSISEVRRLIKEYDGNKEGRYVAEIVFHLWAKDDQTAIKKLKKITDKFGYEAQAQVTDLVRQEFGKLGNSPVDFKNIQQ